MNEREDNFELLPGFDPNKLKLAELRGLLNKYQVNYNSAAKKSDLVKTVQDKILIRAPALLLELSNVRASDHGIIDGESQNGSLAELDTDSGEERGEELPVAKKGSKVKSKATPRKGVVGKKGKSKKVESEEDLDDDNQEELERESNVRPAQIKRSTHTEELRTASGSSKRRLGSAGPEEHKRLKGDSSSPEKSSHQSLKYESGPESGFSDFNPFQSGGEDSPKVKSSRRKSSMGPARNLNSSVGLSGRKSLPAPQSKSELVGSWSTQDNNNNDAGPSSSSPYRPVPVAITSSSAVASPRYSLPSAIQGVSGIAPVKYMVPIDKVKRSPPEVVELQRKLGLFEQEDEESNAHQDDKRTEDELGQELENEEEEEEREDSLPSPPPPAPVSRSSTPKRRSMAGGVEGVGKKELRRTPAPNRIVGKGRTLDNQGQVVKIGSTPSPISIKSTASSSTSTLSFTTLILTFICYLLWYREETIAAGFCDTSLSSNTQIAQRSGSLVLSSILPSAPSSILSLLDTLHIRPSCTPCPQHAICSSGSIISCEREYVLQPHILSFGGLIPIAPKCAPDTEKLMAVAEGASRASRRLRGRRGEVICEGLLKARIRDGRGEAWTYGVGEERLKEGLRREFERSGSTLNDEGINEIITLALSDLEAHDEVISETIEGEKWFASKTADMSLTCQTRLAVVSQAQKHKTELSGLFTLLIASLYLRSKLRSNKAEKERVKELVQTALQLLRDQERLHHTDAVLAPTSSVAASHLRDLVLQNEHSLSRRVNLWSQVEKVVEGNSNVRAKQVELNGEEVRAWEWNGAARVTWDGGAKRQGGTPGRGGGIYPEL